MITEHEKRDLIKEVIAGAVPEIIKAVKEELAAGASSADQEAGTEKINYQELVRNAIK